MAGEKSKLTALVGIGALVGGLALSGCGSSREAALPNNRAVVREIEGMPFHWSTAGVRGESSVVTLPSGQEVLVRLFTDKYLTAADAQPSPDLVSEVEIAVYPRGMDAGNDNAMPEESYLLERGATTGHDHHYTAQGLSSFALYTGAKVAAYPDPKAFDASGEYQISTANDTVQTFTGDIAPHIVSTSLSHAQVVLGAVEGQMLQVAAAASKGRALPQALPRIAA